LSSAFSAAFHPWWFLIGMLPAQRRHPIQRGQEEEGHEIDAVSENANTAS
jgi:hypothetical protein